MAAPILLLHGLFGSLSDQGILSCFGTVSVLAPDLIGYGANRHDAPESWTLEDQADYVAAWLRGRVDVPVRVVGHSVDGAVAVLFARRHPGMTLSLTSVEGNFTLRDAFWSQKISIKELPEIEAEVASFRADLPAWLARSGVPSTPWTLAAAQGLLDHQPAATLRAQARAVVAATGAPAYLDGVRELLASGPPLHLVAGARSRAGWSVPDWVVQAAASNTDIPGTGHLMMLEAPDAFAGAVLANFPS